MQELYIELATGDMLTIREAMKDDAQKVIQYINLIASESDNLTFGEGEFAISLKDEENIIETSRNTNNSLLIVAEINGEIVGNLTFFGGKRPRIAHIGEFGISVAKSYWGIGIGRKLLEYLINWAKSAKIIRKINLKVRTDNHNAIKLYESMGFKREGLITRSFYIDDRFYDAIEMGIELD